MGDTTEPTIALDSRLKVEARIRQLEGGQKTVLSAVKASSGPAKYDAAAARSLAPPKFNQSSDMTISAKRKIEEISEVHEDEEDSGEKKKKKKDKDRDAEIDEDDGEKKKKKKKDRD